MAQISREEFMRRFGRPMERPQPQNIPGLPTPDEVIEGLRYVQELQGAQAPAALGRPAQYASRNYVRLRPGGRGEGYAMDRAAREQAIASEMERQSVRDALASIDPASPFAAVAAEVSPEQVLSAALGRPVSPSIANRAKQYVEILNLTAPQAVKLAEREALAPNPRQASRVLPTNWVQVVADTGELGPDPAAQGLLRAAIEGAVDETTPIEAQARALDPYLQAAEAVVADSGDRYRVLTPGENAEMTAISGGGRKTTGGRRNPFNKEVKERVSDPYLVPVLLSEATEPIWRKNPGGQWEEAGKQPATIVVGQRPGGGKQRVYDASAVKIGLLDPRAELPADLGYLRRADPDKTVSGGYGREVNAPTLEQLGAELHGFAARDDLAAVSESVPMTLGQAVQDIIYRNRTPLVELPHADVAESADGRLLHRQTGVEVFPVAGRQSGGEASATYRYGRNSEYDTAAFREFGNLIEAVTGQRPVVNERLQDSGLWRVQRAALDRSLSDDWRSQRGATSFRALANPLPGQRPAALASAASLPVEGSNPTYDLMRALARGSGLSPAETAVQPMAANPSEQAFYEGLLNPQLQQLHGDALAAAGQAGARPRSGSWNTSRVSDLNAPASPSAVDYTPEIAAQIPAAARGNVEAGLQAPSDSPRFRAAQDFLARFMARLR